MTDCPDPTHAPGCFGSALIYKPASVECGSCIFASNCAPLSAERLARLRAKHNIMIRAPKSLPPRKTVETPEGLVSVPKKVEELMQRLEKAGVTLTDSLARGKNPFPAGKPRFLHLICHVLLRLPNGIHRDLLRDTYAKQFDWAPGTAAAHALQASQLLVAVGAATELDGVIQLRRTA